MKTLTAMAVALAVVSFAGVASAETNESAIIQVGPVYFNDNGTVKTHPGNGQQNLIGDAYNYANTTQVADPTGSEFGKNRSLVFQLGYENTAYTSQTANGSGKNVAGTIAFGSHNYSNTTQTSYSGYSNASLNAQVGNGSTAYTSQTAGHK